jgi:hypothetical protein
MTTHYSAAEIGNLVAAANLATKSRESPARTMLHVFMWSEYSVSY